MKREAWIHSLQLAGFDCTVLPSSNGSAVVLLNRGVRILGIFPDSKTANALWVHPDLANMDDPEPARQRFLRDGDWNVGGERTWISPEMEYFVADSERMWETYQVQSAIDPGEYVSLNPDEGWDAVFMQSVRLDAYRTGETVSFKLRKRVRLAADPLAVALEATYDDYSFIGCETEVRLDKDDESGTHSSVPVSLWNIMQVPATGEVWIPTYGTGRVADFFAPTGPSHLSIGEGMIRFRIDAVDQHKISVKALYLTGRVGYTRQEVDGRATLLVRNFAINPSADYLDVSADNPNDRGHCLQCYNDNGLLGAFGEVEYHTPVLDCEREGASLIDRSGIWCYSGKSETIERIRYILLGR